MGTTVDFWTWWAASAKQIDASIGNGTVEGWSDRLTEHVHAVDEALVWELAPGLGARHQLVVTAEGNPEKRAIARRWLLGAPPATDTWEYADARQRVGSLDDLALSMNGEEVSLGDVVVGATREGNHYNVAVHHRLFSDPAADSDKSVAFIALDAALGELEVETWLWSVEVAPDRPEGGVPLEELRRLVDELAQENLTDGRASWVLLRAETGPGPVMAAASVPLASAVAPHLDQHVSVRIPFADRTDAGLPAPEALEALRDLEDHLTERLAASGRLVAHETTDGVRELHFYVDAQTPATPMLETAAAGWSGGGGMGGRVEVTAQADPAWAAVQHLRT